ncbi:NAD(P)-binding protein [Bradyrhizobium sp. 13971]
MREEMGFVPRDARWRERPSGEKLAQQHVLIVGAGVCAIALGVALGRLSIPYTIVEKQDEIGGTWYVNRYPGCGVDTPNHSYSFSFGARNPWTRYFAQRQELLDYLLKVVREYDIRKHVRLNTELVASRWDEGKRRWISTLKTAGGEETFEVHGAGQRNRPAQ